ncbi:MFS transporter [Marinobacter sp. M3C]|jgi:DHA1 family inner membrane transport protein|uniref:MFS transporter n=1 Tax=unclassified Marinobacter TaxID=83889 RepID=UPI0020100CE0|nr:MULTISPECIES: MFS transporter [unclassified Marinobacter]MCL1479367.1 MFS transporter [Marinobacter sp.]MCL1484797.1 MFS transporter [Marinobacter sp.]UQG56538.1 MFS transporter [Marinobacter sp. M4C]UQG62269.1 MFS transporter [Marinobacter sp. M3C]UQG65342.1 MFS transporter [Marinobacter sp. M2C]
MPIALYALTAGAFGIGVTEFVIMGLLLEVGAEFGVSIQAAGWLISGYALGVVVGAPLLTAMTGRWPRKTLLLGLMVIFTLGNAACALAPSYGFLMAARVLTAFAHGTFFGVGSVVATGLVAPDKRASAIAFMFTGLTLANILGVPSVPGWTESSSRTAPDSAYYLGGGAGAVVRIWRGSDCHPAGTWATSGCRWQASL